MNERKPLRVRVEVPAAPMPGLLRPAIERRLAGGIFPGRSEDVVGRAVAEAVAANEREREP